MTLFVSVRAEVSPTVQSKRKGMLHCAQYYKDAMLDRFFAICNCCACCCGAMRAHQHGTPMLASSGFVARVDAELCAACGSCADSCQFAAISVYDGFARIDASVCMGCGVCVSQCPQEAISLLRDPAKGEPLDIQTLIARAAESAQRFRSDHSSNRNRNCVILRGTRGDFGGQLWDSSLYLTIFPSPGTISL